MNLPVYIWWTVHSTLEAVGCSRFQDLCPFLSAMHRILNFSKFYSKWERKFKVCSQSWFASGLISVSLKEVGCFVWGSLVIFSDCFPDRVPTHLLNLCFSTPSEKKDVSDHQDCKPFKDLLASLAEGKRVQGGVFSGTPTSTVRSWRNLKGSPHMLMMLFSGEAITGGFSVLVHFIFAVGKGENTAKIYSYF